MNAEDRDVNIWLDRRSGKTRTLREVISLILQVPGDADKFTSTVPLPPPPRTFSDYFSVWLDSDGDVYLLTEVAARVRAWPQLAKSFHTSGWISGVRGMTFEEFCETAKDVGLSALIAAMTGNVDGVTG
jgi:hypothetical protein